MMRFVTVLRVRACLYLSDCGGNVCIREYKCRIFGLKTETDAQTMRMRMTRLHLFGSVSSADERKNVDEAALHDGAKL
jgi:hypothetical protein